MSAKVATRLVMLQSTLSLTMMQMPANAFAQLIHVGTMMASPTDAMQTQAFHTLPIAPPRVDSSKGPKPGE